MGQFCEHDARIFGWEGEIVKKAPKFKEKRTKKESRLALGAGKLTKFLKLMNPYSITKFWTMVASLDTFLAGFGGFWRENTADVRTKRVKSRPSLATYGRSSCVVLR